MKIFFRRIHLYLALAAGLIITVTCLTGAILVFEEELQQGLHHSRYYTNVGTQQLPATALIASAEKALPGLRVTAVKLYADKNRTAELSVTEKKSSTNAGPAKKGAGKGEGGKKVFLNPYTGAVAEVYEYRKSGFYTVFSLHRWMLGGDIGKLIVGTSTLIFLFILITGIVLWWPKNKAILKHRLRMKWGGWKRINHDFHIVLGFYSAIFLFIFAFTGLAWSFEWFNKGIYTLTNSSQKQPVPPASSIPAAPTATTSADIVLQQVRGLEPEAKWYNISLPKGDSAALSVTVLPNAAANEAQTTAYYFDQYSGQLLRRTAFTDRNLGQRVRSTFKPIHTGSIFGWPSKIVAFITCLLGGFFPLTGCILWINRITRRKKKPVSNAAKAGAIRA